MLIVEISIKISLLNAVSLENLRRGLVRVPPCSINPAAQDRSARGFTELSQNFFVEPSHSNHPHCYTRLHTCSRKFSSLTEARSPFALFAPATNWALPPLRCIPMWTATRCTCAWPTRPITSAQPPRAIPICGWTRIIEVAKKTGTDAIHPGYGFLAERAGICAGLRRQQDHFYWPVAQRHRQDGRQGRGARNRAEGRCQRHPRHRGRGQSAR